MLNDKVTIEQHMKFSQTWFIYSSKRMSRIVFTGLETALAKVKVITAPTLKPRAIYGEHLTSVTPKENVGTGGKLLLVS